MTTVEFLCSLFTEGRPDPVLLLGAGASVKSGIPLSDQIVTLAARWAYCRNHGRSTRDPTVVRSDWLPWLESFPWYVKTLDPAENYSAVIEHLLQPREERREFFLRLSRSNVPPSGGYERLVDLMVSRTVRTVLTTNFDTVFADLCRAKPTVHHVEVIRTPADYPKFSTDPRYPQVVYLHGSVEHYTDKNLLEEVQRLDDGILRMLLPVLRDHPLIVIGYRGAEPSIMCHLLRDNAEAAGAFRKGVFWCALKESISSGLHPLVRELSTLLGGNFQVVPIEGFDELMEHLASVCMTATGTAKRPVRAGSDIVGDAADVGSHDMAVIGDGDLDEYDWSRVQICLLDYCNRMSIKTPQPVQRAWLIDRLCELDLAQRRPDAIRPTIAGYLLFGKDPTQRIAGAGLTVKTPEREERQINGNLWQQLDSFSGMFQQEFNSPFRLKGMKSETVFPYPQLAVKEVIVNALVHRRYDNPGKIVVSIEPESLRVTNPGGLMEGLDPSQLGTPGVKGYRNPVLADLFYGSGAMDKAGSGLVDVRRWTEDNNGRAMFGPDRENTKFEVTLYRRPEMPHEVTGTAAPQAVSDIFVGNVLELRELPASVCHGLTPARRPRDIVVAHRGETLPVFALHDQRLYTFSDLSCGDNPLRRHVTTERIGWTRLEDYALGEDGRRRVVHLLNELMYRHLTERGLVIDKKRKRAHFPRTAEGVREITYQARFRKATRTVTRPILSRVDGGIRYWENEALRFHFNRYSSSWVLLILPCYVFTRDGGHRYLEAPKIGRLATRRAARDYNPQVDNDLVFWASVLSAGEDGFRLGREADSGPMVDASLISCEMPSLPAVAEGKGPSVPPDVDAEELEDEIARLAEEELEPDDGT